jgi:hypothetical protein
MKKYLVILIILPLSMLLLLTSLWLIASFIQWDFREFPIKELNGENIRVLLLGDLILSAIIYSIPRFIQGEND